MDNQSSWRLAKTTDVTKLNRFWISIRFLMFVPVAMLLILGYLVAGLINPLVITKQGRDTIRRFWTTWWQWVVGKISTYDLIK